METESLEAMETEAIESNSNIEDEQILFSENIQDNIDYQKVDKFNLLTVKGTQFFKSIQENSEGTILHDTEFYCNEILKDNLFAEFQPFCNGAICPLLDALFNMKRERKAFKLRLLTLCFNLLSTKQTLQNLDYIYSKASQIIYKNEKTSYLNIIMDLMKDVLNNLGATFEDANMDSEDTVSTNICNNFNIILKLASLVIKKENILEEKYRSICINTEKRITFIATVFNASTDEKLVNSKINQHVLDFLGHALMLLPSENVDDDIFNIIGDITEFWENETEAYSHNLAYFVITFYIPSSDRGQIFRGLLASFMMTVFLEDEGPILTDKYLKLIHLNNYLQRVRKDRLISLCQNSPESFEYIILYIYYIVPRPLVTKEEKEYLKVIITFLEKLPLSTSSFVTHGLRIKVTSNKIVYPLLQLLLEEQRYIPRKEMK